jgi:Family of unknown function (DUF6156)
MKLPVLLFALAAIALTVLATWHALAQTHRPRDPIAYYQSWGGYWHPIGLYNRITKKAEEVHASGEVYLIGEYNEKGQLVRVTKMYRGEVFFEYNYSYHDNGRLKSARVARGGREKLLEWDERGRPPEG